MTNTSTNEIEEDYLPEPSNTDTPAFYTVDPSDIAGCGSMTHVFVAGFYTDDAGCLWPAAVIAAMGDADVWKVCLFFEGGSNYRMLAEFADLETATRYGNQLGAFLKLPVLQDRYNPSPGS